MSESPIELRGRGGGVVFQGTQVPGGGSQPVIVEPYPPSVIWPNPTATNANGEILFSGLTVPAGTYSRVVCVQVVQGESPLDPGVFIGVWDSATLALLAATADMSAALDVNEAAGSSGDCYLVTTPLITPLAVAAEAHLYVGILDCAAGGPNNNSTDIGAIPVGANVITPHQSGQDDHAGQSDYTTLPDPLVPVTFDGALSTPQTYFGLLP